MPAASFEHAVRRIRALAAPATVDSDRELLERFRSTNDEAAFAALIERHGSAVFGVCRRILGDRHAAEDAFQASFLILARRASQVREAASVGSWLHGVAFRVSTKLKNQLARLPRTSTAPDIAREADDVSWREVRRILDEEVHRLPDRQRSAILLCYFEGKTRDEAATQLGWKLSTLRGRLEDGRERLRVRLARRGVELSAALLAVSAADTSAIGDSLIQATVRTATGTAPNGIRVLAEGFLASSMYKWLGGALALAMGLSLAALPGGQPAKSDPPAKPSEVPAKEIAPEVKAEKPKAPEPEWGDATLDVRARLRLAKSKFQAGEPLTFAVDLKNIGKTEWVLDTFPSYCEVELDDVRYRCNGFIKLRPDRKSMWPDETVADFVVASIDETWRADLRGLEGEELDRWKKLEVFALRAGTHTVRVKYPLIDMVGPTTQTVKFEVTPALPVAESLARRADRVWVVASPTKDTLLSTPIEVLKGPLANLLGVLDLRLLPADDPKKKWIVFLQADENQPVPDVQKLAGTTWYVEHSDATVESIRKTVAPTVWGEVQDGLRMGLRLREDRVEPRQPVFVEVTIQNIGERERSLDQHRFNIYDYWPNTEFEVTAPDGTKFTAWKLEGAIKREDQIALAKLKPGASYTHVVRLDQWSPPFPPIAGAKPKNLFLAVGRCTIRCRYVQPKSKIRDWAGSLTSNEVKLTIGPVEEWGQAVAGLQGRVRLARDRYAEGDSLAFDFDLRNGTAKEFRGGVKDPENCSIILDGKWYGVSAPRATSSPSPLIYLQGREERSPFVSVTTDKDWTCDGKPLELKAGKHTLQIAYPVGKTESVRSQELTFNVEPAVPVKKVGPAESNWGTAIDGIQARVRLARDRFAEGDSLAIQFDLRNTTDKKFMGLDADRYDCVIQLDGVKYRHPRSAIRDSLTPPIRLEGKEERTPLFNITTDKGWHEATPARDGEPKPIQLLAGKHTLQTIYPISERESVRSQELTFEVGPSDWGPPAENIRLRLRLPKKFVEGDALSFALDVSNRGDKDFTEAPVPYDCDVELDGLKYKFTGPIGYVAALKTIKPSESLDDWVTVKTDRLWQHARRTVEPDGTVKHESIPLVLKPGKHTLRVAYQMTAPNKMKPISQAVEFVVEAKK